MFRGSLTDDAQIQRGIGVAVGRFDKRSDGCAGKLPKVVVEAFWTQGSPGNALDPLSCSPAIEKDRTYHIVIISSDNGYFEYELFDVTAGQNVSVKKYINQNAKLLFPTAAMYPSSANYSNVTGVWIVPLFDEGYSASHVALNGPNKVEYSLDFSSISASWYLKN